MLKMERSPSFVLIREKMDCVPYFYSFPRKMDEKTLARELAPFSAVRDNYPKVLLTLDTLFADADYDGVGKRNVIDWLLE